MHGTLNYIGFYENNSRLKANRSVYFFCTVRCTKNEQIAFIYLQPVNVDDLPRNGSDHRPSPLPAPSPRSHSTAILGTAPRQSMQAPPTSRSGASSSCAPHPYDRHRCAASPANRRTRCSARLSGAASFNCGSTNPELKSRQATDL